MMRNRVFSAIGLACLMTLSVACAAAVPPKEEFVVEQNYDVERLSLPSMELITESTKEAVTGEILTCYYTVKAVSPYTVFYVPVTSVLKGEFEIGQVIKVIYFGGDINEYLYLALHGWDHGPFAGDIDIERAMHTSLRYQYLEDFNTKPGSHNLFLLAGIEEDSGCYIPAATMADMGDGTYHWKDNIDENDPQFTVTLDEMRSKLLP